jgi:prepilin-type N-terminal cleavage/methylation domain-containing protein
MTRKRDGQGFTLIEVLLVVVILGLLAVAVVMAVRGITDGADESACEADKHNLVRATEAFFAKRSTTTIPPTPPTSTSSDRFEATLDAQGFLSGPSKYHDVGADGSLIAITPCSS